MIKWNRWAEFEPPKDKAIWVSNNMRDTYGVAEYRESEERWVLRFSNLMIESKFWSLGDEVVETFAEYQLKARSTAVYPEEHRIVYPAFGLASEAGEVCDKIKKALRGDPKDTHGIVCEGFVNMDFQAIKKELGDVLWYISILAEDLGYSLQEVAQANIEKLAGRERDGTIKGSGDER